MEKKLLDLKKSVYELTEEYPEIVEILKSLGFENIANPAMLKTAGRIMTLPKGARMKGIELEKIQNILMEKGFTMIHQEEGY